MRLKRQKFDVPKVESSRAFFQITACRTVPNQPVDEFSIQARLAGSVDNHPEALLYSHVAEVSHDVLSSWGYARMRLIYCEQHRINPVGEQGDFLRRDSLGNDLVAHRFRQRRNQSSASISEVFQPIQHSHERALFEHSQIHGGVGL
jgi:hypothetical protein